jgi:hypothetical protein
MAGHPRVSSAVYTHNIITIIMKTSLFTTTAYNHRLLERLFRQSMVVLLKFRVKCSGLRAKTGYISGHLLRVLPTLALEAKRGNFAQPGVPLR